MDSSRIAKMFMYVTYLGKFDDEFNIRDQVRYLTSLFNSGKYEIASLLLQAPKSTSPSKTEFDIKHKIDSKINITKLFMIESLELSITDYFIYIPWSIKRDEIHDDKNTIDLRESIPLKDYSRYKKSISSSSFINKFTTPFASSTSQNRSDNVKVEQPMSEGNKFVTSSGKKYKLQSLDAFFSDIPEETIKIPNEGRKKRIINTYEEESSSEYSSVSQNSNTDDSSSTSGFDTSEGEDNISSK